MEQTTLDFPIDPTPSLEAYEKFTSLIEKYLAFFVSNDDGLSIGPIKLGTHDRPFITAPIEMDPREIYDCLRPTTEILKSAIEEAKKSIHWTKKILDMTNSKSDKAENRMRVLGDFIAIVECSLKDHSEFGWHPGIHKLIEEWVERSFRRGDPRIPIQITIFL